MKRENYNDSYKVAEIANKIAINEPYDKDEFISALSDVGVGSEFLEKFADKELLEKKINLINVAYEKKDTEALLNILNNSNRRRSITRNIMFLTSSVAAVIIFVLMIVYYPKNDKKSYVANAPTIALSYNEPVIIEGGKTIVISEIEKQELKAEYKENKLYYSSKVEKTEKVSTHKVVVPSGCKQSVILSDGSEVIINSLSSLSYPSSFTGNCREVVLEGEAYFKIKKGEIPFVVKVRDLEAKVYGTEFNINEFNSEVTTVLVKGKVGISLANNSKKEIILAPNQKLVVGDKMETSVLEDVNASDYLSWMDNHFKYHNQPLSDLLKDMARWYNIRIVSDKKFDNYTISIFIPRTSTLEDVFKLINMSNDLIFINKGGGVYEVNL